MLLVEKIEIFNKFNAILNERLLTTEEMEQAKDIYLNSTKEDQEKLLYVHHDAFGIEEDPPNIRCMECDSFAGMEAEPAGDSCIECHHWHCPECIDWSKMNEFESVSPVCKTCAKEYLDIEINQNAIDVKWIHYVEQNKLKLVFVSEEAQGIISASECVGVSYYNAFENFSYSIKLILNNQEMQIVGSGQLFDTLYYEGDKLTKHLNVTDEDCELLCKFIYEFIMIEVNQYNQEECLF